MLANIRRWLASAPWVGKGGPGPIQLPAEWSRVLLLVVFYELIAAALWRYVDLRQMRHLAEVRYNAEFDGIVAPGDFESGRLYAIDRLRFNAFRASLDTVEAVAMLLLYGFPLIFYGARILSFKWFGSSNEYVVSLVTVLILSVISALKNLPFALYNDFVVEERHGFNKKTLPLFFMDFLKELLLVAVLTPPLLLFVIYTVKNGGKRFYYWLWGVGVAIQLVLMVLYPTVIQPLFNKVEPLKDAELREQINALAKSVDYPLKKIFEIDASTRSAHSNAYLYGFGRNKRIVLFDTLLKAPREQVLAIVGHELGHWKLSHTIMQIGFAAAQQFALVYTFGLVVFSDWLYEAFGFIGVGQPVIVGVTLFSYLLQPITTVSNLLRTLLTRRFEFEADAFAASLGMADDLRAGLVQLHAANKATPSYDPVYAWVHLTHPHILERLRGLRAAAKKFDADEKMRTVATKGFLQEVAKGALETAVEVKKTS